MKGFFKKMIYTDEEVKRILKTCFPYPHFKVNFNYDFALNHYAQFFYEQFIETEDERFDYDYGISKFVIIPKNADYVIKIPFTGFNDNEPFYGSDNEDNFWDYCQQETENCGLAIKAGFADCIAKMIKFQGTPANFSFPVYLQEKCIPFKTISSKKYRRRGYSQFDRDTMRKELDGHRPNALNLNWLIDFKKYFGLKKLIDFIDFIDKNRWNDLCSGNIGYIENRPVLIDYSGFYD